MTSLISSYHSQKFLLSSKPRFSSTALIEPRLLSNVQILYTKLGHVELRLANKQDVSDIVNFAFDIEENELKATKVSQTDKIQHQSELEEEFDKKKHRAYVIYQGSQLIGCACLSPIESNCAGLSHVYVAPAFRRQKLGLILVEKLLEHARQLGYERVYLHVHNKDAVPFYRDLGFKTLQHTKVSGKSELTMVKSIKS